MEKHERACTANPNRVCGMCAMAKIEQKPLAYLDAILVHVDYAAEHEGDPQGEKNEAAIKEETQGCPACVLATLRQTKKNPGFSLDWKEESKSWLETHGKTRTEVSYS
jgi:hypothetical protein